jgi:hypothetical protein
MRIGQALQLIQPQQETAAVDPTDYGSLAMWLDFSDTDTLTVNENGKIMAIEDKVGTGIVFAPTQESHALGYLPNARNGLSAGDAGVTLYPDMLASPSSGVSGINTAITCFKHVFTEDWQILWRNYGTATESNAMRILWYGIDTTYLDASTFPGADNGTYVFRRNNTGTMSLANNQWHVWAAVAGTGTRYTTQIAGAFVGNKAGRRFRGCMGEAWFYTNKLDADAYTAASAAMMAKWGIS